MFDYIDRVLLTCRSQTVPAEGDREVRVLLTCRSQTVSAEGDREVHTHDDLLYYLYKNGRRCSSRA
jgi:hypothetical protein